jgi:hypothetical protein
MSGFFVRKFFPQLLCAYNLGLYFLQKGFGAKAAHKMLVKLTPEQQFTPCLPCVMYLGLRESYGLITLKMLYHRFQSIYTLMENSTKVN